MKKSDFHYELPPELIAQAPLPQRSASRLLVVPPGDDAFEDMHVRDLPSLLRAGDLLVFNDTRVIPARLFGQKASGGRVEILIERLLPSICTLLDEQTEGLTAREQGELERLLKKFLGGFDRRG